MKRWFCFEGKIFVIFMTFIIFNQSLYAETKFLNDFCDRFSLFSLLINLLLFLLLIYIIIKKNQVRKKLDNSYKDQISQEVFRNQIFDNSCTPIILMDADTYKYIDCNLAAIDIYGFNSKEVTLTKSPMDVSTEYQQDGSRSSEKAVYYIEKAKKEGSVVFDWKHQRPDGTIWDAEVHLRYFTINSHHYLQFSLIEITDRLKSQKLLNDIIMMNPMSIQIVNKEGFTLQVNPAHTRLFGAVPPRDYSIFTDHLLLKLGYKSLLNRVKEGHVVHFPIFYYNTHDLNPLFPDVPVWIRMIIFPLKNSNGIPEQYVLMHEDFTDIKMAEEALIQSENLAKTVIDNASIGISVRSATGQLLLYNEAWLKMWEITEERLEKDLEPREKLVFNERDDYYSPYQAGVKKVYTQGGSFVIPEIQTTGKFSQSGKPRVISQHFSAITNKEGIVEKVVILSTDITETKEAEAEKEKLQSQLIHAQKMESVGRLAGGVAHDFNNMLGVIIGYTDLALNGLEPNSVLYHHLQEISKAANKSANLTRQLLAFARKQAINPIVLDLNESIKGMKKMLSRMIGEDIRLVFNPLATPALVEIDPSQIDQILANLCVNARDAIKNGGEVSIEIKSAILDEDYCDKHIGSVKGEYICLMVSDNGSGMDKETMANIFEPFYTTKETGKGTGLGLATVYGIIKQNQGYIEVYSELNIGTTFKIYLKKYHKDEQANSEQKMSKEIPTGSETILLVEDEKAFLNMTCEMLEMYGYNVLATDSPAEALLLAEKYSGKIQLLITDVIMPEINGRDLSFQIMNLCPGIKRLFMSGYTANVIEHHGVLDKDLNFIQKPFNIEALNTKVREVLNSNS